MPGNATRTQIIEAADDLFYRQGYDHTSFADIADAVRISRGNFYHHFKSKDQILDAVIERRLEATKAMLTEWEREAPSPRERIEKFIHILLANRSDIERYGCPVGTLTTELAKLEHASQEEAARIFGLFRTWLVRQFTQLGRRRDADHLAMHLLAMSQGLATLANAFPGQAFVRREVRRMYDWLQEIADEAPSPTRH